MPKRIAVAYARYSSENQREESIDAQLRAIKEYAKRENIRIVNTYIDRAKTATNDNRPEFKKMIQDSKKGVFEIVLVHKMNRFSRDRYDDAINKKKLQRSKVKVVSTLEHLDDSPMSVITEAFLVGMAEYESKTLSLEVMKGSEENAYSCKHNGGLPPLGYDVNSSTQLYEVNDETATIIKDIYNQYLEGVGYTRIANDLNDKGFQTTKGNRFSVAAIKTILTNPKYKGTYVYNRAEGKDGDGKKNNHNSKVTEKIIRIEDGMPEIISKEKYQKVQDKIALNTRNHNTFKAKRVYLLSGIIKCGECGGKLIANKAYNKLADGTKKEYFMYRCNGSSHPKEKAKSIRVEDIEDYILHQMELQIFEEKTIVYLSKELNKFCNSRSGQIKEEMIILKKNIKKKESEIENILNAIMGGFQHESLKEKLSSLESQKEDQLLGLQKKELISPVTDIISVKYLKKIFKNHKQHLDKRQMEMIKNFIKLYVKEVVVYNDYVEVVFTISEYLVEQLYGEPYHK